MNRLRVLLHAIAPGDDPGAIERAYHDISTALAGTPGLLGNELLASTTEPGKFVVMSEWESAEAFRTWEVGSEHRGTTAPLRPYQDRSAGSPFGIYEVAASYSHAPAADGQAAHDPAFPDPVSCGRRTH